MKIQKPKKQRRAAPARAKPARAKPARAFISYSIIFNLLLSLIAISFMIGLEARVVSSQGDSFAADVPTETLEPSTPISDLGINPSATNTATGAGGKVKNLGNGAGGATEGAEGTGILGKLKSIFKIDPAKPVAGMLKTASWALTAYWAVGWLGPKLGLKPITVAALQKSVSAGLFTTGTLKTFGTKIGGVLPNKLGFLVKSPWMTGIAVGAIVFLLTYKKEEYKVVSFNCLPWEAPVGGEDCEKCNDGIHACSEYRCKSLGQACEIVNAGTDKELCVWTNPKDVTSPNIAPWSEVLTEGYSYTNTKPRPPAWGTSITPKGAASGCVAAFSPIEFGIQTNKPAQCKVSLKMTETFDEMEYLFGETNLYDYNHSQKMNIPNPRAIDEIATANNDTTGGLEIQNDNNYNLYVRCSSKNGYYNKDPYVIKFCVDEGSDLTPPAIEETSIKSGQPVASGVDNVTISVYTNEPTNCKWARDTDQSFEQMPNNMVCYNSLTDLRPNMLYECETTLTGIKDSQENNFYFKCEDQPWKAPNERNKMSSGYKFTLLGTKPLNIDKTSIKPVAGTTVSGATSTVTIDLELQTQNGFNKGEAECYYSTDNDNFISFFETNSYKHKQSQDLTSGFYNYYIKCIDLGGNQDSAVTNFTVFVDTFPPQVVRVMYDTNRLKIITDENAECRYSTDTNVKCNFDIDAGNGNPMPHEPSDDKKVHLASWTPEQTYYVKCKDESGKQPDPTQCTIILSPTAPAGTSDNEE